MTAATPTAGVGRLSAGIYAYPDFPEDGVRSTLEAAGHAVAFWHASPQEALDAFRQEAPDLLLLGARRLNNGALESIRSLIEATEASKVILVTERSGQGEIRKALDAGVMGFLALGDVEEALPPVIEVVNAGQISVPGSRGRELHRGVLTTREKQILGLVVMGMSNAEIAGKLYLAESTVKSHLSSAFAKLGVSSRSEATSVILDPHSNAGLGILTIPTK